MERSRFGDVEADGARRRELANRVEVEALGRLANTGWTDAAREVSLRVRQNKARIRELLKDRPDGTTYRDAGGTWVKRGGDVELVRVDGLYAAGQNNGRFITELAAGRPGDYFDPYSKGTVNAMERYGYLTPAQGAAARAFYGYGDTANRAARGKGGALENTGWTDEARAASLIVRRGKAAGKQLAAPGTAGKSGGAPGGSPVSPKRWSGDTPPPGIRAPTPEDEARLGNPNTEYEGMRIRGPGGSFEVKNGVLRRMPGFGTGRSGDVAARMFKTVLGKMAAAGVDVINGLGPVSEVMRPYLERIYGVKKRPPVQY